MAQGIAGRVLAGIIENNDNSVLSVLNGINRFLQRRQVEVIAVKVLVEHSLHIVFMNHELVGAPGDFRQDGCFTFIKESGKADGDSTGAAGCCDDGMGKIELCAISDPVIDFSAEVGVAGKADGIGCLGTVINRIIVIKDCIIGN